MKRTYMYRGFGWSSISSMEKRSVAQDSLQNRRGEPPGIFEGNERDVELGNTCCCCCCGRNVA